MSNSTNAGNDTSNVSGSGSNKRLSSIDMSPPGFSPYDIPMSDFSESERGLDDYQLPSISTVTTSFEYGDGDLALTKPSSDVGMNRNGKMPHGFFFGAKSLELLNTRVDDEKEGQMDDDEDFSEDDDIREIYSSNSNGLDRWMRASQRSFKPSPEIRKREVLSKRIKDVGSVGHNLGIGHLTGVWKEDSELRPKQVTLQSVFLYISEESPLQHDLCWQKPENASTFSSLVYNVDVMLPDQEHWVPLTVVRHTVFRIYHTDHKLFVGKFKIQRQNYDLNLYIRVCCNGEVALSTGDRHWIQGPWSKDIELAFIGYGTKPIVLEQTVL